MSEPNSADFALIKLQTADGPPAVMTLLCGVESATINRTAQTSEQYRRDCAKPNRPGTRKMRVTGSSWQISGSGNDNIDLETEYGDAFGVRKNYSVELYKDDGTDAGELMGTYAGTAILTTRNQAMILRASRPDRRHQRSPPMFTEPTPPKAQLTWNEQRRIIRAALSVLHPAISEIRPDPTDTMTLATHLEIAVTDALGDIYAVDAVPRLFHDMSEAALAELLVVSSERGMPFS